MINPVMVEIAYIQGIICPEHVRVDDAIRLDALLNDGHERFCSRIGDYGRINLPIAFSTPKPPFSAAPRPRLPFLTPPK